MRQAPGDHPKCFPNQSGAARQAEEWRYFRATLETFVAIGIDLLDAMGGEPDDETDGTDSEDDEGEYSIPGRLLLSGATEDDEPDDI